MGQYRRRLLTDHPSEKKNQCRMRRRTKKTGCLSTISISEIFQCTDDKYAGAGLKSYHKRAKILEEIRESSFVRTERHLRITIRKEHNHSPLQMGKLALDPFLTKKLDGYASNSASILQRRGGRNIRFSTGPVRNVGGRRIPRVRCSECTDLIFKSILRLEEHLTEIHGFQSETQTHKFSSVEEFNIFKRNIEEECQCFFTKGQVKGPRNYYFCHRSGIRSYTNLDVAEYCRINKSEKIGATCPARINNTSSEDGITVFAQLKHVGHNCSQENEIDHISKNMQDSTVSFKNKRDLASTNEEPLAAKISPAFKDSEVTYRLQKVPTEQFSEEVIEIDDSANQFCEYYDDSVVAPPSCKIIEVVDVAETKKLLLNCIDELDNMPVDLLVKLNRISSEALNTKN